jgi:energy-coupling factor transport system permease protein
VLGVCIGVYGLLDASTSTWLGLPLLAVGALVAAAGLVLGGRRTRRTRYRPDPWALPEWLVAGSGVVCAALMVIASKQYPDAVHPPYPLEWPTVPLLALVGVLVGVLPAVLAPLPPDRVEERRLERDEDATSPEQVAA